MLNKTMQTPSNLSKALGQKVAQHGEEDAERDADVDRCLA